MTPCKHLRTDGALHKSCPECKVEALEQQKATLRELLLNITEALKEQPNALLDIAEGKIPDIELFTLDTAIKKARLYLHTGIA